MTSRKTSKHLPARVLSMIAMVAIMVGLLFSFMLSNWIAGTLIGIAFAGGLYFAVIVQARRATKKRKRR